MHYSEPLPARTFPEPQPAARLAGALYFVVIGAGITAEFVLRGPAAAFSSGTALADSLRLSVAADVVMLLADIALAILFFGLLAPVSRRAALSSMVLRLMQAATIAASLVALLAASELAAIGQDQTASALITAHAAGYDLGLILFGANGFFMAYLLCHSGAVPRIIVAGIAAAALVYVAGGFLRLLAPDLTRAFEPAYLIALIAETALALWLVFTGRV